MKIFYSVFTAVFVGALLNKLGLKRFEPWDQVTIWGERDVVPSALIGHAHFYRYLVSYPGFLLERQLPNFGFSIYISAFIGVTIGFWYNLVRYVTCAAPRLIDWAIFLTPYLFMNGRGAIAWASWVIIVWQSVRIVNGKLNAVADPCVLSVGFLFASVTTGVFATAVLTWMALLIYFFIKVFPVAPPRKWYSVLGFALVILLVQDFFFVSIGKNMEFFGEGVEGLVGLTEHGAGWFLTNYAMHSAYVFSVASVILCIYVWLTGYRFGPFTLVKLAPIFGGVFGFTVLTLALPLVSVRGIGIISRRIESKTFTPQRQR